MKYLIVTLAATLWFVPPAHPQEEKAKADAETAFNLYKERLSEGGQPTLTIKNGESKLSEGTNMYPGEYTGGKSVTKNALVTGSAGGEFVTPKPSFYLAQIQALKDQVETLKKLNAELEKELAAYKSKP